MSEPLKFPAVEKQILDSCECHIHSLVKQAGLYDHTAEVISKRLRDRFSKYVKMEFQLMVDLPYPECASDHEKELLFQAVKNLITECKKACEEAFVTKIIPDFVDLESRVYFLEE